MLNRQEPFKVGYYGVTIKVTPFNEVFKHTIHG